MATISLNTALYNEAQHYALGQNMSVEEWVSSLILKFLPTKKEKYRMKELNELSPELQQLIGFAKPVGDNDDDINGDKARTEYLMEKFEQ